MSNGKMTDSRGMTHPVHLSLIILSSRQFFPPPFCDSRPPVPRRSVVPCILPARPVDIPVHAVKSLADHIAPLSGTNALTRGLVYVTLDPDGIGAHVGG